MPSLGQQPIFTLDRPAWPWWSWNRDDQSTKLRYHISLLL